RIPGQDVPEVPDRAGAEDPLPVLRSGRRRGADAGGDRLSARRDPGADPADPQPRVREAAREPGRRGAGDVLERELTDRGHRGHRGPANAATWTESPPGAGGLLRSDSPDRNW